MTQATKRKNRSAFYRRFPDRTDKLARKARQRELETKQLAEKRWRTLQLQDDKRHEC